MSAGEIAGVVIGLLVFATGLLVLLGGGNGSGDAVPTAEPSAFVDSVPGPTAVVWAVGDGADGGAEGRAVGELVASGGPQRFLYLGDVYETGTPEEFEQNYDPLFGSLNEIAAPTVGNHEAENEAVGYYPYWSAAKGVEAPRWYSFSVAGWQFLAINTTEPHGRRSPQMRWLRKRLSKRGPGTCRIAFMHHPRYSAGFHDDDRSIAPISGALRGRAAMMVAAHDHNMQRLRPPKGLTQLISGAGGHGLYEVDRRDPRLRFSEDRRYGALRLELRKGRATASFIATGGAVLDRSRYRCKRSAS